jgi:LuxR family transcriptional regulator, quorum-sensing system regulator SolR
MKLANYESFSTAVTSITSASDLKTALQGIESASAALGFERFALIDRLGSAGVRGVYHNAPLAWAESQEDLARLNRDPVLNAAARSPMPIAWDQSDYEAARAGRMWAAQAAHGYRAGICAASGPPDAQFTILLASTACEHRGGDATQRQKADVMLLAVYCHDALMRLAPRFSLRPRELECLDWTLMGKTSWETAAILGISERTVNQHLARAMSQLGVSKKKVAATIAVRLGLLPLSRAA